MGSRGVLCTVQSGTVQTKLRISRPDVQNRTSRLVSDMAPNNSSGNLECCLHLGHQRTGRKDCDMFDVEMGREMR